MAEIEVVSQAEANAHKWKFQAINAWGDMAELKKKLRELGKQ